MDLTAKGLIETYLRAFISGRLRVSIFTFIHLYTISEMEFC